ncbi:MAG: hypothetical protein AABZ12_02315 [Planctomycetota bacterium]
MRTLVPNRFLFSFEIPIAHRASLPRMTGRLADWTDVERLPNLGEMDGRPDFADVWACWNSTGLAVACRVEGRRHPLICNPKSHWTSDNLRLCIDTRDARTNRRVTRFCHQLFFLPTGAGRKKDQPAAGAGKFQRTREEAPTIAVEKLQVAAEVRGTGYSLEAFVPAECLFGFDPEQHPRIGFYYLIEDRDFGQQYLTVGDDLAWNVDPSTWATAVLAR